MSARGKEVVLTARAEADFANILLFTNERWGVAQRDRYAARLYSGIKGLATFHSIGRISADIAEGTRAHVVGQHLIYYRVDGAAITVLRILHVSMDAHANLES